MLQAAQGQREAAQREAEAMLEYARAEAAMVAEIESLDFGYLWVTGRTRKSTSTTTRCGIWGSACCARR